MGLVLEGGGALGFAHVGVLKVLEEEQIPVHFIAGTSMGSIVGAGYASGMTVSALEEVLSTTDWDKLFNEAAPREMVDFRDKAGRESELFGDKKLGYKDGEFLTPTALVEGAYVELLFQRLFESASPVDTFDDLPIPYRAVAADLITGEPVVIDRGSLALAARASMSVPGFFTPVDLNDKLLVDGGIVNNFPVDLALNAKVDVIIAVKLDLPPPTKDEITGPLSISAQVLNLLLQKTSQEGLDLLRSKDVLIRPDIAEYTSTSFNDSVAIMKRGEEAARAVVSQLRALSIPNSEFDAYQTRRTSRPQYQPRIDFVRVKGVSLSRAAAIEASLKKQIGEPLDRLEVDESLQEAIHTGSYQTIAYEIESEDGKTGIVVNAKSKEWLKDYFRMGFALEDDFDGSSSYSLALNSRFNELNSWEAYGDLQLQIGRTERFFAELYQPIGEGSSFFIAPDVTLSRVPLTVRQGGESVARYERKNAVLGLKAGLSFGRFGELRSGWFRGPGSLDRDIGEATLPEFDYDVGEIGTTFIIDQYDNPDFPTSGYLFGLSNTASRDSLGGSDNFEQSRVNVGLPITSGMTTLLLSGEYGYSSDDLPVERSYSLGGMFDISGFEQRSLTADNYWIGRSVLFYRFAKGDSSLLNFGGYFGGTLEYASLRSDIEAIGDRPDILAGSVFVGVDTPLFPVYLGFGMSDESEKSLYLNVGRISARQR